MFILSQDKKQIINTDQVTILEINRNFGGGKDAKFCLTAPNASINILANYPDEGTAQKELIKILAALENDEKVYYL